MDSSKTLSTTALAKELNIPTKTLFETLINLGLIVRQNDSWELTRKGQVAGGTLKTHPRLGTYIAWEETIKEVLKEHQETGEKLITATALSKHFNISKFRINPILSELGFVEKSVKGWRVTKLGEAIGGKQFEFEQSGVPYVSWNESILKNKIILETFKALNGDVEEESLESTTATHRETIDFRNKFEAKHRAADGHYVRSRAEMLIDNWLYMSEIVHAYERKLPIEEDVYCDFYLPVGKVYIEFWGMESDERYMERKRAKIEIYEKYGFNLIQLNDADIQNLDDYFPKKLLKFGIQAY